MAEEILTIRLQDMAAAIKIEIKRLDRKIDSIPPPSGDGGGVSDGDKGDIVVSGSGANWNFDAGVVSPFGRTVIGSSDAAGARSALGLGTAATASAASFAAVGHSHVITDVTGLQTALDGKLASSGVSAYGLTLVGAANAGAARTVLALGTAASAATGDFASAAHVGSGGAAHAVAGASAGFMSAADKAKLDGVATSATANSSDATLLARANHTGTQLSTTIFDFVEASQDVTGAMVVGAGGTYNDVTGAITFPSGGIDRTNPISAQELIDDFFPGSGETGEIGAINWSLTNGTTFAAGPEANNPGIVGLRTSATANQVCSFHLGSNAGAPIVRFDQIDVITQVFRPTAANTDCAYQFGAMASFGALTTAHGIWLERLSTDTNWFFVTANNSVQTRVNSGVAFGIGWFNIRIRRESATDVRFSLNGGAEVSLTTNIPDAADTMNIGNQRTGTTVTTRDVLLDFFSMKTLAQAR